MLKKISFLESRLPLLEKGGPTPESVDLRNDITLLRSHIEAPTKLLARSETTARFAQQLDYKKGLGDALVHVATAHWYRSDFDQALKLLVDARAAYTAAGHKEGDFRIEIYVGSIYRSLGDLDESYLRLSRALEFYTKNDDVVYRSISRVTLGMTCLSIGDVERAIEYIRPIVDKDDLEEHTWIRGRALTALGAAYAASMRHDEALACREEAIAIFRDIGYRMGEASALNDIGDAHRVLGDLDRAIECYRESLAIRREVEQKEAQCTSLTNIGQVLMSQGKLDEALTHLTEAMTIAIAANAKQRVRMAHETLSRLHEMRGELDIALGHAREYVTVNNELMKRESERKTRQLKTALEVERAEKDAEIERLRNVELKGKNEQLEALLAQLEAAQSQLVQSEKMAAIGKIVASVMHELNTPLGASNCATDVARRCMEKLGQTIADCQTLEDLQNSTQVKTLLTTLGDNLDITTEAHGRIDAILNNLRSFTRVDEADYQEVDIHDGLDSAIALLEPDHSGRVEITREYATLPAVTCYAAELNQVFMNLLTNAIEAIKDTGSVKVKTTLQNGAAIVEIKDTGVGIPADKIPSLFDPSFNRTGGRVRAGLGLVTSHNIIAKHNGRIEVESAPGAGSTFRVSIPLEQAG